MQRQLTVSIESSVMEVLQDGTLQNVPGEHIPSHIQDAIGDVMQYASRRLLPIGASVQVSVDLVADGLKHR